MMIGPNRTPTEAGVYALLDLISNPKSDAYKAALDKLVEQRSAGETALAEAVRVGAENTAKAAAIKADSDKLTKALADHTVAVEALKSAQAVHLQDVEAHANSVRDSKVSLKKREDAVKEREDAADQRERKLTKREKEIGAREAAAQQLADQAQATIMRLQAALPPKVGA